MSTKLSLTLDEAAAATGYSARALSRAAENNDLVLRYANRKPVVLVTELQEWLESLPTEPPTK